MSDLENRTRYEPSEAERRVFERWEASGACDPEPSGSAQRRQLARTHPRGAARLARCAI